MSLVFDALQRADEERSGVTTSLRPMATELLERAEREARAQRQAETRVVSASEELVGMAGEKQMPNKAILADTSSQEGPRALPPEVQTLHLLSPLPDRLVAISDPSSPAAEAFRLLSIRLRELSGERPLSTILISSTSPQEGKSLITANLACTLARESQKKVLLLEGDMRRPSQDEVFGFHAMPGLCEYFRGERSLKDSIYRVEEAGIWFLPAGHAQGKPPELIQAAPLSSLGAQVREWFDWVIVDSPPILPLADTSVWEKIADGVLLVARRGVTEKRKLKRGVEAIDPKKMIGAILNSSTRSSDEDYYYYKQPSIGSDS